MNRIWTIGHSTRSLEQLCELLQAHEIKLIADVRLLPGSKRYPQFNKETLAESLRERGIAYAHFAELGGRRKARPDSRNTVWRNESFRGYADHMETAEFARGITNFLDLADQHGNSALMCAEAVWWRCHRALVSDYLKARGVEVLHILAEKRPAAHPYTSAARINGGGLSYAEETPLL